MSNEVIDGKWGSLMPNCNWKAEVVENQISFVFFTFMRPCIVTNFFVIKRTGCTNFTNLF